MMKTKILFLLGMVMALNAFAHPKQKEVLEALELANDYFLSKYPDPGKPTFVKRERPSNLWTRGVYFEGLSALVEVERLTGGEKSGRYEQYILDWGTAHKWMPRNGVTTRSWHAFAG